MHNSVNKGLQVILSKCESAVLTHAMARQLTWQRQNTQCTSYSGFVGGKHTLSGRTAHSSMLGMVEAPEMRVSDLTIAVSSGTPQA